MDMLTDNNNEWDGLDGEVEHNQEYENYDDAFAEFEQEVLKPQPILSIPSPCVEDTTTPSGFKARLQTKVLQKSNSAPTSATIKSSTLKSLPEIIPVRKAVRGIPSNSRLFQLALKKT